MTIIPDIYDKIGAVLNQMRSDPAFQASFSSDDVYARYVALYPGDDDVMRTRQSSQPTSHSLKGYLNGMVNEYQQKTDGRDPNRPAIVFSSEKTYSFNSGT
jgi:hypothetical protein